MTSEQILACKRPEQLFPSDVSKAKKLYHDLAMQWHPDLCKHPKASEVAAHLNKLYHEGIEKVRGGHWGHEGHFLATGIDGTTIDFLYLKKHTFEMGEAYIGANSVTWVFTKTFHELARQGAVMTSDFKYASDRMKEEMSKFLPKLALTMKLTDGRMAYTMGKTPDAVLLRDVLNFYKGRMDPKHVAWVISRLHNIACYLSYAKIAHNEISPDTVFISPQHHSAMLLGGWWYSMTAGKTLEKVSSRTFGVLPWKVRTNKRASRKTDQELIRLTGRELLGDLSAAPKPMVDYLKSVSSKSAVEEYSDWGKVLDKSFGARKFTVMDLTADQLYKEGK